MVREASKATSTKTTQKMKLVKGKDVSSSEQQLDSAANDSNSKTIKRKSDFIYMTRSKRKKSENWISSDVINQSEYEIVTRKPDSKARKESNSEEKMNSNIVAEVYGLNEIIWGKLKGSVHWPAKIIAILPRQYEVIWLNDYRKSKLFRSQMCKFTNSNFKQFSCNFGTTIGVETAAKEALIMIGDLKDF